MRIRKALPHEQDDIYRMGFDVWNDGQALEAYLEGCRQSRKYQAGQWFVLENEEGVICSSLIRYVLSATTSGIGSIATPPSLRSQGHALKLISGALKVFEVEGYQTTFLFSDIESRFYEAFGFVALPLKHQHHPGSVCMVRGILLGDLERDSAFQPPGYF